MSDETPPKRRYDRSKVPGLYSQRLRIQNGKYRCKTCKEYKEASEFSKASGDWTGVSTRCKVCNRDVKYQTKYGITLTRYNELLEEQGGKCAICEGDCSTGRNLAVDHDHKTGKARGLLCAECNTALARVEIPGWAKKAVAYIKEHRG